MPPPLTLEALFAQPDNAPVLRLLKYHRPEDVGRFEASAEAHPLDEGGMTLFHRYGRLVPESARCSLSHHSLLAHERTARIFALLWGRYTFALRRDFSRWDGRSGDHLRYGETLDGTVDLRSLGPAWALFHPDDDDTEPEEVFRWAHELAGRCDPSGEPTDVPRAFDLLLDVLRGKRVPPGPADAKLTYLLLSYPASDIHIDARRIVRRRAEMVRPKLCAWDRYGLDSAPVAVGHLLDRAGLSCITEPVVVALSSAPIWALQKDGPPSTMEYAWSVEPPPAGWSTVQVVHPPSHCAWFNPGPTALDILLRAQPELPSAPRPIPTEGPFAPPRPLHEPHYLDAEPPRQCPHCQQFATRFRDTGDRLVCLACGLSFEA